MEDNYIPYGPEWEKEMLKLPKKFLINMIRIAQIRLHLAEESVDVSSCENEITEAQLKAYAEWMASKL